MEATTKVKLKSLAPYRHLFPKSNGLDKTVKMGATVSDTVQFIPKVIKKSAWQVEKYVKQELIGLPLYEACEKLWDFVKYHIEYRPDERGIEQVRSPRRLIADAFGDCDCGSTYIGSCLFMLNSLKAVKIPFLLRITKYKQDHFQHIYPVVIAPDGKEIIMDFVVHAFNYEEPYTEKKDYKMDLQFLDGIDKNGTFAGVDAQDLSGYGSELSELGKLLKKRNNGGGGGASSARKPLFKKPLFQKRSYEQKQQNTQKRKEGGKKVLKAVNKANKINPATALLRAGILASMKLNVMKVAEKLKWGYASPALAQSKGMDMSKYGKIKEILAKTEKIFFAAGGKPENLRKAMLTGNGNRNNEVAGIEGFKENTPLSELLGVIYNDEFIYDMEGFKGFSGIDGVASLGEPATAASIAAATATMGTLAALLKTIGELFPKKDKSSTPKQKKGFFKRKNRSEDASEESEENNSEASEENSSEESGSENEQEQSEQSQEETSSENYDNLPVISEDNLPVTTEDESSENSETQTDLEGTGGLLSGLNGGIRNFYDKNKKWLVPVGVVAITATVVIALTQFSKPKPEPYKNIEPVSMNGVSRKKRRRSRKGGGGANGGKQSVIALM